MPTRFLCCADVHVGRVSSCLNAPTNVDLSTMGALTRLVDAAIEGNAAGLLIAGDLFDGLTAFYSHRNAVAAQFERLKEKGIAAVAVAGNHDAVALPAFAKSFPNCGLQVIGLGGQWQHVEVAGTVVYGWSFPRETYRSNAAQSANRPSQSQPVIGLLHGDRGAAVSDYQPFSDKDLEGKADVWILGHVHLPDTHPTARYMSSPQAMDFGPGERGAHGAWWVEVEAAKARFGAFESISTVRYELISRNLEVSQPRSIRDLLLEDLTLWAKRVKAEQESVQSVQARVFASLRSDGFDFESREREDLESRVEESGDGRDAFHLLALKTVRKVNPSELVHGGDTVADLAKVLLGAKQLRGEYLADVQDEWQDSARKLVDSVRAELVTAYPIMVGSAMDTEDGSPAELSEEEATKIANDLLIAEIETRLSEEVSK